MPITDLETMAKALVADGKGIPAVDETPTTVGTYTKAMESGLAA